MEQGTDFLFLWPVAPLGMRVGEALQDECHLAQEYLLVVVGDVDEVGQILLVEVLRQLRTQGVHVVDEVVAEVDGVGGGHHDVGEEHRGEDRQHAVGTPGDVGPHHGLIVVWVYWLNRAEVQAPLQDQPSVERPKLARHATPPAEQMAVDHRALAADQVAHLLRVQGHAVVGVALHVATHGRRIGVVVDKHRDAELVAPRGDLPGALRPNILVNDTDLPVFLKQGNKYGKNITRKIG